MGGELVGGRLKKGCKCDYISRITRKLRFRRNANNTLMQLRIFRVASHRTQTCRPTSSKLVGLRAHELGSESRWVDLINLPSVRSLPLHNPPLQFPSLLASFHLSMLHSDSHWVVPLSPGRPTPPSFLTSHAQVPAGASRRQRARNVASKRKVRKTR